MKIAAAAKKDSFRMAALTETQRNNALARIAAALDRTRDAVTAENRRDLAAAEAAGLPDPIIKRLKFDDRKLDDVIEGIRELIALPDPIGRILSRRQLDEGLILEQLTCPIGVIGVIFESRPDALVQIATLCLKSGNCAVLKGGSEAFHTNRILADEVARACQNEDAEIPKGFLTLLETREDIADLLKCDESIDLIIPRGSNAFVKYIMDNSNIPVMGHSDGICHVYVDKTADLEKAVPIIVDSKTQYVAACNTTETILIHRDIAAALLPKLRNALQEKNVLIHATAQVRDILSDAAASAPAALLPAAEENFRTEYLDYIVNIKIVDSIDEAIDHINEYGSHHTDCIITEDATAAEEFMQLVDSAGVYQNCSTRFADGFRYGLGAEVGISTGKLHARGPVGLEGLETYKYRLYGSGQIVEDYAEGRKSFHFKEFTI
jgi:glutamate-5-semialdehyde dehydrogenase